MSEETSAPPIQFHHHIIDEHLESGRFDTVHTRFSPGAERLFAYRPCEVNLPEFWRCPRIMAG